MSLRVFDRKIDIFCNILVYNRKYPQNSEVIHIYYKTNIYYVDNLEFSVVEAFIKSGCEKYYGKFDEDIILIAVEVNHHNNGLLRTSGIMPARP
jgi:hypothetical protein